MLHCKVPGTVFMFVTLNETTEDMHTQSENNLHIYVDDSSGMENVFYSWKWVDPAVRYSC